MPNKIIYTLDSFQLTNGKKLFLVFLPNEQPIDPKELRRFIKTIPQTLSLTLNEVQSQIIIVKTIESDEEPVYYILNFSQTLNISFNTFGNGTHTFFQQFLDLSIYREETNA